LTCRSSAMAAFASMVATARCTTTSHVEADPLGTHAALAVVLRRERSSRSPPRRQS
jgi:hypothetical protein